MGGQHRSIYGYLRYRRRHSRYGKRAIGPWVKPKKDGYRFDGWYLGETLWDFATVVPSDITLVAHWVEKSDYLVYDVETTPLHLVYSTNGISKERDNAIYDLFTHLSNILDTEPTLAKDGDRVPIDNEVVVGKTIRIISNRAYGILNMLTREQGERLFIIYVERSRWEEIDGDGEVIYGSEPILSENGYSVSIAYDDSEGDVVAVAAINYFIETYAGEEFAHAPGVLCVGRIAADGTMTVSEPSISAAVPEAEDDPDSLKQDFESVEVGDILPEGMEIAGQDGHELDPMSSITVAQKKNGNKYIKIVTWDTYVHPGAQEWNGWEGYREGYANTDLIIRPKDASETDGYFVASFNMSARYFTSMSYGAGSDKRALFLKLFDTEGNEKISLKFAITDAGYSVTAEGAVNSYPASVNLRENVNFRFVYCIADGLVYCYCDDVLFAAMEYGTAGQAADLGYMRFDFTNSLISQLEIDNVLVANNIASKN